ncbi:MAG: OmpA family protein [Muribaculaceae bacterium]|nr:OmpA family protein [Muribaculaceae bacterium]
MKLSIRAILIFALVSLSTLHSWASSNSGIADDAARFESMVMAPAVSQKASAALARHIETIREGFASKHFNATKVNNQPIVKITIPASEFFAPNSASLDNAAYERLMYFRHALTHPEYYRLVVAVHTDDTGDDQYSQSITEARAQAIKHGFDKIATDANVKPNVSYFALGKQLALNHNSTMTERATNRRIEVYIIPTNKVIDNILASKTPA